MKVEDLQRGLEKAGFSPGPIDGDLGRQTRSAIRAFQEANHLTADGIAGPRTLAVMQAQGLIPKEVGERETGMAGADPTPAKVEKDGTSQPKAKRLIHTIVVHCTATPEGREFTRAQIDAMHKARGFNKIGYHRLVHLDGSVSIGRFDEEVGAHVAGYNSGTLGFSYVGGLGPNGKAKDTRTPEQKAALTRIISAAVQRYPIRAIVGHRDLSPDRDHDGVVEPWEWVKQCPCFNAVPEYGHLVRR